MINVLLSLMIVISFLLAIALHEWAHAQMASWLGDQTPRLDGRQTLSLRAHLDPVGMVMCLILAFQPLASVVPPAGLGWGKPVKPDPWKMRVPADTGVLLVACAGLIGSLIIGLLAAVAFRFLDPNPRRQLFRSCAPAVGTCLCFRQYWPCPVQLDTALSA